VNDTEKIQDSFVNISHSINLIAAYQFGLWTIAYVLGHVARLLIRFFDWDKKYRIFRFNNEWHYILTGEITRFPTVQLEPLRYIDYKVVNALVRTDKGTFIYAGILQDYNLTKDGVLDTVCLSHVMRRPIDSDRIINTDTNIAEENKDDNESRYFKIPGSILVIPYTNILNFNLHYIQAKASDMEVETPLESDEGTNAR
jgi:hypothetical protein